MSLLTGRQRSMRSKDKQDETRADEKRLFPSYGHKDEGTPIKPGETIAKKKKPAQQFSSKPFDGIPRLKQSGPVRSWGKQRPSAGQGSYRLLDLANSELQSAADFEPSERPAKRRRRNPQETSQKGVDDMMKQPAPIPDTPSIPQLSPHKPSSERLEEGDHRQMEHDIQPHVSSDDERFTENAAKERRDMPSDSEGLSQDSKPKVFQSVEIQMPKLIHQKSAASLKERPIGTDGCSDTRESSDELQGAPTVQPIPTVLPAGRKKDISNGCKVEAEKAAPSDVQPTYFSSSTPQGKKNRKKAKSRKRACNPRSFEASLVRIAKHQILPSDGKPVEVHVDPANDILRFSGDSRHQSSLRTVVQFIYGVDPSHKVRLGLSKKTETHVGHIDIELSSAEGKKDLLSVQGSHVKVQSKPSQWMDSAFKIGERDMARFPNGSKRLSSESVPERPSEPRIQTAKRPKLSASLEAGDLNATFPSNDANKDRSEAHVPANNPNESPDHTAHSHPPSPAVSNSVEIPVKKWASDVTTSGRATRSMLRHEPPTTVVCDDDDGDGDGDDPGPQPVVVGEESKRWEKPIVYPRFGKKKAEVDAQDCERLRDNEFLNDNLIGFYIRFLEDHLERTNKEAAKKVYFFNSYFYATLTNKRPINYESVQKWTRAVDIFSHDYVVVPINESAHWYVAIICNLPNLQRISQGGPEPEEPSPEGDQKPPTQPEAEIQAIPETPVSSQPVPPSPEEGGGEQKPDSESAKEEIARKSMAAMTLVDQGGATRVISASDEDWPEKKENPTTSPARFSSPPKTRGAQQRGQKGTPGGKGSSKNSRKQKKKPREPRDPGDPIIITFDSLDLPRSPTIRNLRLYLSEEAKSKKGVDIDVSMMAGLRAQAIPLQSNYSDCGLYLLAYLEKFVQDPDLFVSRLLRKEMSVNADWPPLTSGHLRLRLRKFLDGLYDEQEQLSREQASEKHTMADRQPISFLLGEQEPEPKQTANPDGLEENPGPEATEAKSSPQPGKAFKATPATPPPPTPPPPPQEEVQHSTAGPFTVSSLSPDTPARNLRQRDKKTGPSKAVRTVAALYGFNQRTDQGADGDAVQVPDSQEQDPTRLGPSSPEKEKTPDDEPDGQVSTTISENKNPKDVVTVDDDDDDDDADAAVEIMEPPPKGNNIEVQVRGTPPSEDTKSSKGKH